MSNTLLSLQNIHKQFGGLIALTNVSLHIKIHEIYGLIGPNGAGKTTLFNILTGLYRPTQGSSYLNGKLLDTQPHKIAKSGIARTFQNIRLFSNMTALENVMVGYHMHTNTGVLGAILHGKKTRAEEAYIREQAQMRLEYVGIGKFSNTVSKYLSYGDQRKLEIARALATSPLLLALDEPAAGMNATETKTLQILLTRIRKDGITILLIEHDIKLIMELCDRVAVLDYGKKIAEDIPAVIQKDPTVIAAYLGTEVTDATTD